MRHTFFLLLLIMTAVSQIWAADPLPWANPWDVGMNYEFVNKAYEEMATAIGEGAAPGAVGLVIKDGHIVACRAIGNMQTHLIRRDENSKVEYVPYSERMLEETIFDLASVTKMVATTTSIMILLERGQIALDDPVVKYIPTFGARAKDKVTLRHLLTHTSGLPAWFPFQQLYIDREDVYRSIDEDFALLSPPGEKRVYSDLGFMMLGRIVETVSGKRLDKFTEENIFEPMGMKDTGYLPRLQERQRIAPTEYDVLRDKALKGIVHDENTQAMGGVSGHAGLFSTVHDLAIFAQMLLNQGEWNGKQILKPETIQTMLTPQFPEKLILNASGRRQLLGWWGMDDNASITDVGGLPSLTCYMHTGFTGTSIAIDPEHKTAAILLTNAVHPKRENAKNKDFRFPFYANISKALVGEASVVIKVD